MKFVIKDKVIEKKILRAHTSYPVSEVLAIVDGAYLVVPWGYSYDDEIHHEEFYDADKPRSRGWREAIQRYTEDELLTPEESFAEMAKLNNAVSQLGREFDAVKDQIQSKLAVAAKLTDEAASLLVKTNKTFEDVLQESVPLYKALKKGGWRHSTLQCKVG